MDKSFTFRDLIKSSLRVKRSGMFPVTKALVKYLSSLAWWLELTFLPLAKAVIGNWRDVLEDLRNLLNNSMWTRLKWSEKLLKAFHDPMKKTLHNLQMAWTFPFSVSDQLRKHSVRHNGQVDCLVSGIGVDPGGGSGSRCCRLASTSTDSSSQSSSSLAIFSSKEGPATSSSGLVSGNKDCKNHYGFVM